MAEPIDSQTTIYTRERVVQNQVTLDIPSRVVVKVLFIVLAFWIGVNIFGQLRSLVVQLAIAAFIAVAADPIVRRLQRAGLSRGRAVIVVALGGLAAIALLIAIFVPPLVEQAHRLTDAAPSIIRDVRSSSTYHDLDARFGLVEKATDELEHLPKIVAGEIGTIFGVVAAGLFGTITIFFLVMFLLTGGGPLVAGTVRLFPKLTERRWWTIVHGAYTGIGAYVGGALIIALIGGSVVVASAFALGLPYALPLGLWMMLLEVIPMVGATIGAIPVVIVAFVSGGVAQGIVMILIIVVYQQIENIVIQPRVQGKTSQMAPVVVFVSVLAGAQLLGILGALFAVPVAGVIQIFVRQIIAQQGSARLAVPVIGDEQAAAADAVNEDDAANRTPPNSTSTQTPL